ncbi:hypothetical protein C8N25_10248 [Algoriphagus antarcticus]|uniref:Uncharacterized protein n=1 Tax=Algoriphagus antarcticus TaxID=238540 RepID=A0A3E0E4W1_9BACT|nr:hypothetical protein C8N25_10248 [Algoriphagus antarcticus]
MLANVNLEKLVRDTHALALSLLLKYLAISIGPLRDIGLVFCEGIFGHTYCKPEFIVSLDFRSYKFYTGKIPNNHIIKSNRLPEEFWQPVLRSQFILS